MSLFQKPSKVFSVHDIVSASAPSRLVTGLLMKDALASDLSD